MKIDNLVMPVAKRIAALPCSTEAKMKIAEFSGFATGFVGGVVVVGTSYVVGKKIVNFITSK